MKTARPTDPEFKLVDDHPAQPAQTELVLETSIEFWIPSINECSNDLCASIIKTGAVLINAKNALPDGKFSDLFASGRVRIDQRTAQMMMRIAKNEALAKANNYSLLPSTLNSLNVLAGVDAPNLQRAIDDGEIDPTMTIKEAKALVSRLSPKKKIPGSSSMQRGAEPQHRIEIDESEMYVRIIDIIEVARRRCPKEAVFQLVRRLAEYVQGIYSDENDLLTDEPN